MAASWISRIENALAIERQWRTDAKHAVEIYRKAQNRRGFNILWPNTSIKAAALFARLPSPVVRRRFGSDPMIGQLSLMLERALEYQMDVQPDWMAEMGRVVLDWTLPGRGVTRVRYVPKYREREEAVFIDDEGRYFSDSNVEITSDEIIVREDDAFRQVQEVIAEEARIEHVPWAHFTHDPQDEWSDVNWVAFHHKMSKPDAVKAFGKRKADQIVLVGQAEQDKLAMGARDVTTADYEPRLSVWEVWNREKQEVMYVSDGGDRGEQVLEKYADPYGLKWFFPTPPPLRAVCTPGTLVPTTEYSLYEEQAKELNIVTTQLSRMLRQVRVKGAYDASMGESVKQLARFDDNVLVPVENWMSLQDRGGMSRAIEYLPFEQAAGAAAVLSQYRQQLLDTIYQIIGLADIMRGASDPRETASAQQIKSQYGGLRLRPQQMDLQRHIVKVLEMQVELMAEKFEWSTLQAVSRIQVPPEAELIVRADVTRQFAIDIETDSTLAMDDAQQKQERAEFLGMFSQVLGQAAQAQAGGMIDQRAVGEIVKFALAPYRVSRELEEMLESMGKSQGNQQPDLEGQAKLMAAMTKQSEIQLKAQESQQKAALDGAELQLDAAKFQHQREVDREKLMLDALKIAAG